MAQSGGTENNDRGFTFAESFQGSSDTLGTVTKLNSELGYKFGRHFSTDVGVPLYLVHATTDTTGTAPGSGSGIGNPYLTLRFSLGGSKTSFISSITTAAPVGDTAKGLSTGRITVDWNNYLGFTAGKFTPFVNLGLANSITDTPFFTRPFVSLGKVAHFEGGADFQVWRALSLGGSAYADTPFGQQKVFSKLIRRGQAAGANPGRGRSAHKGAFETQSVTIGDSSIARDNGGSIWAELSPHKKVSLTAGLSRSTEYDLNSFFFGITVRFGK